MMSISEMSDFVKSQAEFQLRQATKYQTDAKRSALHTGSAAKFSELAQFLHELADKVQMNPNLLNSAPDVSNARISLSWEEVEDLPPELLSELSISESDKQEFAIRSLILELGGIASLDRMLVALYRKTGEITKRAPLNQKLYRMVQKEMVFSVPGKKGVYSIAPISEQDAAHLV
ncbi:MAG: hypothetical protein ACRDBL_15470 [Rhabdaerophilum sp.]